MLGGDTTNYNNRVPTGQVSVATYFDVWDQTYSFIPRHLLFRCRKGESHPVSRVKMQTPSNTVGNVAIKTREPARTNVATSSNLESVVTAIIKEVCSKRIQLIYRFWKIIR